MGKFSKEILAYALQNAIEFGKADSSKILGKLFQHGMKKNEVKKVLDDIYDIVKEVNRMNEGERKAGFDKLRGVVKARQEKEKGLPELPNASGKVVMRIAPYPSGALHIGNAITFLVNAMYAERHKGELILVMDDTIGSAEKQISKEAYGLIESGLKWLGIKWKNVVYKSDRLKIYYKYALELIEKGKAYVCHCLQEELRENRVKGIECSCRQFPVKIQLERWKEMFKMEEGSATLRIKTSMHDKNPAFRDRVLFKISDRAHPRVGKKYRVWPSLEMSWAIDDHLLGITHIVRGNDLVMESEMERLIWGILGWNDIEIIHRGLVKIDGLGAKISKSKAQQEVKLRKFTGWDDPRTWSLQSLERRGFLPEAVSKFIESIGLTKQDITVPIDSLYSINRKMIDGTAFRYSFVIKPVKLNLNKGMLPKSVEIPVHPDKKETRSLKIGEIFISEDDASKMKRKEIRLLHLFNIKNGIISSDEVKKIPKIQWVTNPINVRVLMEDGTWVSGLAEKAVSDLKSGDIIQFERMFFCRFDGKGKNDEYEFWFAHK